jgi:hypothetical protein
MSALVTADVTLVLGPDTLRVSATGVCKRLMDRSIACTVVDVTLDDRSVLEALPPDKLAECRERLANAFLVEQMRGRESQTDGYDGGPDAA